MACMIHGGGGCYAAEMVTQELQGEAYDEAIIVDVESALPILADLESAATPTQLIDALMRGSVHSVADLRPLVVVNNNLSQIQVDGWHREGPWSAPCCPMSSHPADPLRLLVCMTCCTYSQDWFSSNFAQTFSTMIGQLKMLSDNGRALFHESQTGVLVEIVYDTAKGVRRSMTLDALKVGTAGRTSTS